MGLEITVLIFLVTFIFLAFAKSKGLRKIDFSFNDFLNVK